MLARRVEAQGAGELHVAAQLGVASRRVPALGEVPLIEHAAHVEGLAAEQQGSAVHRDLAQAAVARGAIDLAVRLVEGHLQQVELRVGRRPALGSRHPQRQAPLRPSERGAALARHHLLAVAQHHLHVPLEGLRETHEDGELLLGLRPACVDLLDGDLRQRLEPHRLPDPRRGVVVDRRAEGARLLLAPRLAPGVAVLDAQHQLVLARPERVACLAGQGRVATPLLADLSAVQEDARGVVAGADAQDAARRQLVLRDLEAPPVPQHRGGRAHRERHHHALPEGASALPAVPQAAVGLVAGELPGAVQVAPARPHQQRPGILGARNLHQAPATGGSHPGRSRPSPGPRRPSAPPRSCRWR